MSAEISPPAVALELDGHPPPPNRLHTHWVDAWRRTSAWRDAVCLLARARRPPKPYARARLVATLVYRRRPFRDRDNATASLKGAIDGLVLAGVLAGDGPAQLELEVRQELGPRRLLRLEVRPLG